MVRGGVSSGVSVGNSGPTGGAVAPTVGEGGGGSVGPRVGKGTGDGVVVGVDVDTTGKVQVGTDAGVRRGPEGRNATARLRTILAATSPSMMLKRSWLRDCFFRLRLLTTATSKKIAFGLYHKLLSQPNSV